MATCQWPWYLTPCLRHRLSWQRQSHLGSIKIQEQRGSARERERARDRPVNQDKLSSEPSLITRRDTTGGGTSYTKADLCDELKHLFKNIFKWMQSICYMQEKLRFRNTLREDFNFLWNYFYYVTMCQCETKATMLQNQKSIGNWFTCTRCMKDILAPPQKRTQSSHQQLGVHTL